MKEFLIYFFGKSDTVEFTNFTVAHFVPIIIMLAIFCLLQGSATKYVMQKAKNASDIFWHLD